MKVEGGEGVKRNDAYTVGEQNGKYKTNLRKRLFVFAAEVVRLIMSLPYRKEYDVFRYQLSKSSTSIGANYEESQAGSRAEFRQKINICLREARETSYWLRLIKELDIFKKEASLETLDNLIREADEIQKIFGSISLKVKDR